MVSHPCPLVTLLRPHLLQFLGTVHKLIRIRLWNYPPLIRLLHKVLVTLLVRKSDGIVLRREVQVCALHEVCTRLPSHKWVLPSVALAKRIPVHTPVVRWPVAGLGCGFDGFVDAGR